MHAPLEPTDDEIIGAYIKIRDAIKTYTDECKAAVKPLEDNLDKLEAMMAQRLLDRNAQHSATESGTAFFTNQRRVQTVDRDAFLDFCFASQEWGRILLTKACSKEGLDQFLEAATSTAHPEGFLPPGVEQTVEKVVQFRKST